MFLVVETPFDALQICQVTAWHESPRRWSVPHFREHSPVLQPVKNRVDLPFVFQSQGLDKVFGVNGRADSGEMIDQ